MSTPERAGWYDDPEDTSQLRYFDGIIWSERTVPRRGRPAEPVAQGGPGAPSTDVFGRPTTTGPVAPPSVPGAGHHGSPSPYGAPTAGASSSRTPEPTTDDGQPLASYGVRVGAYVIDSLIIGLLNLLIAGWAFALWMWDYFAFAWDAAEAGDPSRVEGLTPEAVLAMMDWKFFFVGLALIMLVQAIYQIGFLTTRGATPGKAVLGLSVRQAVRGGTISVGTAFMRVLLPLFLQVLAWVPGLSLLVFVLNPADLLWPLRDPRRQALHDKIAGTVVVVGKQPRSTARGD